MPSVNHVQGHVEACGTVRQAAGGSRGWRLRVELPQSLMACVVPEIDHAARCFVDGRGSDGFSVEAALIPETLERANLGHLQVGDPIHVGLDVLCRTVVQTVRPGIGPRIF